MSSGAVTATGSSSSRTSSGQVVLGADSAGSLTVVSQGNASAASFLLGQNASGTGTLQLGTGSGYGVLTPGQLTLTSAVLFDTAGYDVGATARFGGSGILAKLGGGTLTLSGANNYAGDTLVRAGTLEVTGSIHSPGANIRVAQLTGNNAAFTVSSGGLVTSRSGYIGNGNGSTGVATVTGAGSRWVTSEDINVGFGGMGTLQITATVTGTGSRWTLTELKLGGANTSGILRVIDGGRIDTSQLTIGADGGSSSALRDYGGQVGALRGAATGRTDG